MTTYYENQCTEITEQNNRLKEMDGYPTGTCSNCGIPCDCSLDGYAKDRHDSTGKHLCCYCEEEE